MFKQEFTKFITSKKSIFICIFVLLLALCHTIDSVFIASKLMLNDYHPVMASFIYGTSSNMRFKTIFIWLAPIFFTLAYCDKYRSEKKTSLINVYLTKSKRTDYFKAKLKMAFVAPVIMCGTAHLVSLLICVIFLHGNNNFQGIENWSLEEAGKSMYYSVRYPYTTYFLYLLSGLIILGLLGVFCQCLEFVLDDTRLVLLLSTAVWVGVYHTMSYFNINRAMQPFLESPSIYVVYAYASYLPVIALSVIAGYRKIVGKKDEI